MLLSEVTTMRVGGPARAVLSPTTEEELVAAALETWATGEDWLVLGGGSNVLVSDGGIDGTVIRVQTRGVEASVDGEVVHLRVQAGEPWDALVAAAVERGWAGIEALSGIPGSCGAAPIQNIGAYGQELSQVLVAVEFLDYLTGTVERIPADELGLDYRTSVIKQGREGVVIAIELDLRATDDGAVAYPQLASALGVELGRRVALPLVRASVLALRASKGMVLDPSDPDSVSCGSFFTNPIVSENFARSLPEAAPRWPVVPEAHPIAVPLGQEPALPPESDDRVKLSAAWLIEQSGIGRGYSLPGSRAAISSKHTLAIVNRGGATAEEVAQLARFVQDRVRSQFGVNLQPEPVPIGIDL